MKSVSRAVSQVFRSGTKGKNKLHQKRMKLGQRISKCKYSSLSLSRGLYSHRINKSMIEVLPPLTALNFNQKRSHYYRNKFIAAKDNIKGGLMMQNKRKEDKRGAISYYGLFDESIPPIGGGHYGQIRKESWRNVANYASDHHMRLVTAQAWNLQEYIAYYCIVGLTGGLGFFLTPLFRFAVRKRLTAQTKVGELCPRLHADFSQYFVQVYLRQAVFGVFTLGLYQLFGFGMRYEGVWMDQRITWYYNKDVNKLK